MSSRLAMKQWPSKALLLEHLARVGFRTVVVGTDAEAPRAYHSLSVPSGDAFVEIGVISSALGTEVSALYLDERRRILVGHDTWVTSIDVERAAVTSSRRLGGAFFEFLTLNRAAEVVVVHELGALRIDAHGAVKWSVDTDIVETSSIDSAGNLTLTIVDGEAVTVSLESGAVGRRTDS